MNAKTMAELAVGNRHTQDGRGTSSLPSSPMWLNPTATLHRGAALADVLTKA
jgi:hypothetical protein